MQKFPKGGPLVCGKVLTLQGERLMPGDPVSAETAATIPNLQSKLRARIFYIPGTEPQSLAKAKPEEGHRSLEPRSPRASVEPPADASAEKPKKKKKLWSGKPAGE